jgi:nitrogen fixation-related uncharacterized protein
MIAALIAIAVIAVVVAVLFLAFLWLMARTPVDKDEDAIEAEYHVAFIREQTEPVPLQDERARPHVRAGQVAR